MSLRLNFRWLVLSLLIIAVLAGAGFGYWWWINRPDYLYASARDNVAAGEKAQEANSVPTAKAHFEKADTQLQAMLKQTPNDSAALMLRAKVVSHLNTLLVADREAKPERAVALVALRDRLVAKAAQVDPKHVGAQFTMMDAYVRNGQILQAVPHALNLVKLKEGDNTEGDWPAYHAHQSTAHFVLAWAALNVEPYKPGQALVELRLSEEEAQKYAKGEMPRWRAVAVEAKALILQSERTKQAGTNPRERKPGSAPLDELRAKMSVWVKRAQDEAALPVPVQLKSATKQPTVAEMALFPSPTDLPALMEFLTLAVVQAPTPKDVLDRSSVAVAVCGKLTAASSPPPAVLREVPRFLGNLPRLAQARSEYLVRVEKQPDPKLTASPEWKKLQERIDRIGDKSLAKDKSQDLDVYLRLARNAQKERRRDQALRYAQNGLEAAAALKTSPSGGPTSATAKARLAEIEMGLHTVAAWMLMSQRQFTEAEKHLAALREAPDKKYAGEVHLIEGLTAVQQGRLAQGVKELEQARADSFYGKTLYPYLGLAYGYLGLGDYEKALPALREIAKYFDNFSKLSAEEKELAEQLMPNPKALNLEFVRCYLGLGQVRKALEHKQKLGNLPEAQAASMLLARHYLAATRNQGPGATQKAVQQGLQEVASARKLAPDDPRLAWTEAALLARQPEINKPVVLSAAVALGTSPANLGVQITENLRLRQGLNWQMEKAEKFLRNFAERRPDNLDAQLAWLRWLEVRGRTDEALQFLANLEDEVKEPPQRRALQVRRAQLLLRRGESGKLGELARELAGEDDLSAKIIEMMHRNLENRDPKVIGPQVDNLASKHENNGLLLYWQGQVAQAQGDFRQAIQAYEKSMQFQQLKAVSERGLLTSLLGLSAKESPNVAFELATELLKKYDDSAGLLLAYAEAALDLDKVKGEAGMEGALGQLEKVLAEKGQGSPALGAFFLSRGWLAAGRPDLARREARRAVKLDPTHRSSRVLNGRLALAAEDWPAVLNQAQELMKLPGEPFEALLWQATALDKTGKTAEARKVYQELTERYPSLAAGHLGLAGLCEQAKDYAGALKHVAEWRERAAGDLNAVRGYVRLLVRSGQADQVGPWVEEYLARQQQQLREILDKRLKEAPPAKDEKEEARRQQNVKDGLIEQQLSILLTVAQGCQGARAYEQAEAWIKRAQGLTAPLSEPVRKGADLQVLLVLGDLYAARSQQEVWPFVRTAYAEKAIACYEKVYADVPGNLLAGNNLAWLLSREKGEPDRALKIVERTRQGRYSQQPISGDRLPLEFLDTLGSIYRDAKHYKDALQLFQEATARYKDEPKVYLHLGRAQAALNQVRAAGDNLTLANNLARAKAEKAQDPQRKASLLALADEATRERQKLPPR